jgi:RNA processing factor Prp31
MDMIDEELNRLMTRVDELKSRIMPDLESKSEVLYARIMPMKEGSEEREKLEAEYTLLSKELTHRSIEITNLRGNMENLEFEKTLKR